MRTADRTFDPADELMTLSIEVVGVLTMALAARTTVVLDAAASCALTVVVTDVVVGRVVVVRAVVRGAAAAARVVSGTAVVSGGRVVAGATVVAGSVVVGRVVVVGCVVVGLVVVGLVVVGGAVVLVPANAGATTALASSSTTKPNPARARDLECRGGRLTSSSSD